ncbi:DUF4397 domain-containing protein [bacterium]|nr:DUF4397 domain-containing protein [bacterium]
MKTMLTTLAALVLTAGLAVAQTATVQVIHNSPDPAAATVDIYIGMGTTEPAIPDFAFRAATGLVDLPADTELQIGVAPGNSTDSGDVLAWFPVTLPAGSMTVVMATGVLDPMSITNPDGVSTGFTLVTNELMTSASAGNVGLLAYHGSPDAPTVDVVAAGVGVLVPGLTYTDFAGYLEVPEGTYTLQVTPAGVNESVLFQYEAALSGLGGGTAVVFASGALSDFGLYAALNDGTVIQLPVSTVANEDLSMGSLKAEFR